MPKNKIESANASMVAELAKEQGEETEWADPETTTSIEKDPETGNVVDPKKEAVEVGESHELTEDHILETDTPAPDVEASDSSVEEPEVSEGDEAEEYDPDLLIASGLTAEEADSQFGSPQALESAVRWLDSRHIQVGQYDDPPPQQQPQQHTQPPQQIPTDDFKWPTPEEAEEWDVDTKKLVDALRTYHDSKLSESNKEIQVQREALEYLFKERQEKEKIEYIRQVDDFVEGLGEDWEDVFGKGSGFDLPQGSIALQNRAYLDLMAGQLNKGRQKSGHPNLPTRELYSRALWSSFPQQQKENVQREVTQNLSSRQRQFTSRPTQRRGKPMSKEDKAIANADAWYQEQGMPVYEDNFDYTV